MSNIKGKARWIHRDWFDSYYPYEKSEFEKENFEFESELTFTGFIRGRSAARAQFKDHNNNTLEMFLSEFENLIETGLPVNKLSGKWTFHKKGSNVGLKYLGPIDG